MIERVRNPRRLLALLAMNAGPDFAILNPQVKDFIPTDWLSDPRNIALRIDNDLAMFEHLGTGKAMGHIWFHSRGRRAFNRASSMLDYMTDRGVTEIIGEVPGWRRDVQRFVRKLGFTATGVVERPMGRVIVFQKRNSQTLSLVA